MRVHPAYSIPNEPFEALAGKTSRCGGADQRENQRQNAPGMRVPLQRGAKPPAFIEAATAKLAGFKLACQPKLQSSVGWSGRWESNPRHSAWEADVLPLNYARTLFRIAKRGGRRQGRRRRRNNSKLGCTLLSPPRIRAYSFVALIRLTRTHMLARDSYIQKDLLFFPTGIIVPCQRHTHKIKPPCFQQKSPALRVAFARCRSSRPSSERMEDQKSN